MTREERLAREAAIISKNALMNTLSVLTEADRKLEAFDPDEIAIADARVKAAQAASNLIKLIEERKW